MSLEIKPRIVSLSVVDYEALKQNKDRTWPPSILGQLKKTNSSEDTICRTLHKVGETQQDLPSM